MRQIRIVAVDVGREPAAMAIEVEMGGRRYVEDRDTAAVVEGSRERAGVFAERWTLALEGPGEGAWRLVAADARIP